MFLLDKDYFYFSIIDHSGGNNVLTADVFKRKRDYTLTLLRPKIKLLKSDIYDIEISGIDKVSILPNKYNNMVHLKYDDTIDLNCVYSEPKEIKISYSDSKNRTIRSTACNYFKKKQQNMV